MARLKSYIIGGVTLICALAIGYIMQYGIALPSGGKANLEEPIEVGDITLTSSGLGAPRLPIEGLQQSALPQPPVRSAPVQLAALDAPIPPEDEPAGFACDIEMNATTTAGAMVSLTLDAPCHASERVTIHHQGMMFTEVMQPDGTLQINVPALDENATFIAAFTNGEGATAKTDVTSLPFYDRVAVQWKGEAGLQLHAREFSADYFTDGHVWSASAGDLGRAANGEGGFLVRLGQESSPDALMAEVYSFPSGTAKKGGDVLLSIEAEVTAANCDGHVEAQTLQIREGGKLKVGDLTLEMPECDSVGDFLVLKNIVEDLKVAAR